MVAAMGKGELPQMARGPTQSAARPQGEVHRRTILTTLVGKGLPEDPECQSVGWMEGARALGAWRLDWGGTFDETMEDHR